MPASRRRINMLLRAAAMLFSREALPGVDGFTAPPSRRPERTRRRTIRPVPPRQFRPTPLITSHNAHASVKPARLLRLIPDVFDERVLLEIAVRRNQRGSPD